MTWTILLAIRDLPPTHLMGLRISLMEQPVLRMTNNVSIIIPQHTFFGQFIVLENMFQEYESNPLKNSIFENHVLFNWFLEAHLSNANVSNENTFWLDAIVLGKGPLGEFEILDWIWKVDHWLSIELFSHNDYEEEDILEADIHTMIVGREAWDVDILEDFIQTHINVGYPCKIYSQEMLLAFAITGQDPFDAPREVLLAFAEGHPALQYLLNYETSVFDWPSMEVGKKRDIDLEFNLKEKGMLGAFGYKAGQKGKSDEERRLILTLAFITSSEQLPQIEDKTSLQKWQATPPGSCVRLKLITEFIYLTLWKPRSRNRQKNWVSLQDYESDLEWLKETFYSKCQSQMGWPYFIET